MNVKWQREMEIACARIEWTLVILTRSVMLVLCVCVCVHMSIDQTSCARLLAERASCRTLTTTSNLRLYNSTLNHTTNTTLNGLHKQRRNQIQPFECWYISIGYRENMNGMISLRVIICIEIVIIELCKCKFKLVSAILAEASIGELYGMYNFVFCSVCVCVWACCAYAFKFTIYNNK